MSGIAMRELPPLDLGVRIVPPNGGRSYRWALDRPSAADRVGGLSFSSVAPGGYEECNCRLARDPEIAYSDMVAFSTLFVEGIGGRRAGEFRLERAPRVSGDEFSMSPGAVGWQAALDDVKQVREIYVDVDLTQWGPMSVQRRLNLNPTYGPADAAVAPDPATGAPAVQLQFGNTPWTVAPGLPLAEAWYGQGIPIGELYYAWKKNSVINAADVNWSWSAGLSTDDIATATDSTGNLRAVGPGSGTRAATAANRKWAYLQHFYGPAAGGTAGIDYSIYFMAAVFGRHGLTKRGTASSNTAQGLYASDVIANAVTRWASVLNTTFAGDSTIEVAPFIIPHLVFYDATTVSEVIRQANRFTLNDWFVWDNRTFYYNARGGGRARKWRARAASSQLNETGPQVDRSWNAIAVQYTDVSGSTRTVGPPGMTADTNSSLLVDPDTENPVTKAGLVRCDLLVMGTSTTAGAIEVGRRFLEQAKLLDTSGQATLVGYVMDDRGVLHPAWAVRGGDSISFVDASDTSYRRIVRAAWDDSNKNASLDLDSPPEGLQALLERLGVVLVSLGLS